MSGVSEKTIERARSRALEIIASMRAHDARFYREYMGAHSYVPGRGVCEASAQAGAHTLGAGGFVAPGVLATLADMTIGAAIRPVVPAGHRMATAGLTLQVLREARVDVVHARAEVLSANSHAAVAQCRMSDDPGEPLALATATFAIRPIPDANAWLPYSRDSAIDALSAPPVDPAHLNAEEEQLLRRVEESLTMDGPDGAYANYLGIDWRERGAGRSSGVWPLGPHLWNRATHVHGGALFGALAVAALACLPDGPGARVVEQHTQYVRPGVGTELRVEASLLRRGQILSFVSAQVADAEGKTVAAALVTLEGVGRA